jgi:hypothetical protein
MVLSPEQAPYKAAIIAVAFCWARNWYLLQWPLSQPALEELTCQGLAGIESRTKAMPNGQTADEHVPFAPAAGARRQCPLPTRRRPGGAARCAKVVAATVCPLAPVGHNVGMIVMTTMRADLG